MLERLRSKRSDASQIVQPTEIDAKSSAIKKLLIDDGEKMIVISPSSIYYAVPSDRMLEIYTEDKVIESKLTLQELEKKLTGRSEERRVGKEKKQGREGETKKEK